MTPSVDGYTSSVCFADTFPSRGRLSDGSKPPPYDVDLGWCGKRIRAVEDARPYEIATTLDRDCRGRRLRRPVFGRFVNRPYGAGLGLCVKRIGGVEDVAPYGAGLGL